MSHKLDIQKEMSTNQILKPVEIAMSCTKSEAFSDVLSACSCSQCNSVDCFKTRYENASLLCTCPNCKDAFSQKKTKLGGESCHKGLVTKDDVGILHITNSKLYNEKSVENLNDVTKVVKINVEKDAHDAKIKNVLDSEKIDEESYNIAFNKKNTNTSETKDSLNSNTKSNIEKYVDDNDVALDRNLNERQEKEAINSNIESVSSSKKYNSQKNHVDFKSANNDELNAKVSTTGNSNKKSVNKICCAICNKDGQKLKHKNTLNTNKTHSERAHLNDNVKSCCDKIKTDNIRHDQKAMPNRRSKIDVPFIKLDDIDDGYKWETTKKVVNERESKNMISKHIKRENSEVDLCERTEFRYKDTTFIKDKVKKKERSYKESYTKNYSVAMTYTRNEENAADKNPTATLSAQVMNLPYEDFKDSLSTHKTAGTVNTNKITKQDIISKLKEIYEACSCKVCECIPGFSNNDVSNNKTCCEDPKYTNKCGKQNDTQKPQRDCVKQSPHSGCACYRCDREDCRGVWKNTGLQCECKPCDCVQSTRNSTKSCDCKPCECVECASLNFHVPRPVVVAPVQGNFQQNLCQCEPCECLNCTHSYGAMASSLMHEVSTGMVTHRNCNCDSCVNNACQFNGVDCRCDTQNRIVRKPIDRSARDFDIHRAIVEENGFSRKQTTKYKNYDTIAMFAFSNNKLSNTAFNKSNRDCHCLDCTCLVCNDRGKCENRNTNKDECEGFKLAFSNISDTSFSACKCQPCECQVCKDEKADTYIIKRTEVSNCLCDDCNCISCSGLSFYSQHNDNSISNHRAMQFSSIKKRDDYSNNISLDLVYPLKKGNLLTPAMFEAKILSHTKFQSQSSITVKKKPLLNKYILNLSGNKSSNKLLCPQNMTICHSAKSVSICDDCDLDELRYKTLRSKYLDDSYIETDSRIHKNTIDSSNLKYTCGISDSNGQNCNDYTGHLLANYVFPRKSKNCIDNTTLNKKIDVTNDETKFVKSQVLNIHRHSKMQMNSEVELFFSRIKTCENCIFQLQQDISLNRKTLADIRSQNVTLNESFSESSAQEEVYDIPIEKSLANIHKTYINDPTKVPQFCEELQKMQNLENVTIEEIVNKREILVNGTQSCNDNINEMDRYSKGDNKIYTKLIKRVQVNVNKSRKNFTRSKFKKSSRNSENKIINLVIERLKENYRHHGNNKLNHNLSTKSASTSHEGCVVFQSDASQTMELKNDEVFKMNFHEDDARQWSVLRKNLFINDRKVTCKSICSIPELVMNTKCAVQTISSQTNETRGYEALTKLQKEVSKLLDLPLLELDNIKKYLTGNIEVTAEEKFKYRPKSKLDLVFRRVRNDVSSQTPKPALLVEKEINCNIGQSMEDMKIDIKTLMDFLLTRTVCKSELTKPLNTSVEKSRMPKTDYEYTSCDGLKASFSVVRKVSDHTVLVRWKVPREIDKVQGYELQVDGRAVQKILSPTRCMAVLTCLPHCEKLLLTIRTLTFTLLPPVRHPVTTIIYYPKDKHIRYSKGCERLG